MILKLHNIRAVRIFMPKFSNQIFKSSANAELFLVNEEDRVNLLTATGFVHDFHTLPQAAQSEFKRNFERDSIGTLRNGKFIARLRGTKLTNLPGYECLNGKRKMYLLGAAYRVIFEQSGNTIFALAAGPRHEMAAYKRARDRITNA